MINANGNRAEMRYDGHGRQVRWVFPSKTSPGSVNEGDYEEYGYDLIGNRTSLRKRDGVTITYAYDGVNRMVQKTVPASATGAAGYSVFYKYDSNGLQTEARFGSSSGAGIVNSYDGFGRLRTSTNSMGGASRTLTYLYDSGGRRARIIHPDDKRFTYNYDAGGAMTMVHENDAVLANADFIIRYFFKSSGLPHADVRGADSFGFTSIYQYDAVGRMKQFTHNLQGTVNDHWRTYTYNPASQIVSRTETLDAYAYTGDLNVSRGYQVNGLNQYTQTLVGGGVAASFEHDANGNLRSSTTTGPTGSTTAYAYDAENRLVSASGGASAQLVYDPLGRLFQTSGGSAGVRQFLYDGGARRAGVWTKARGSGSGPAASGCRR